MNHEILAPIVLLPNDEFGVRLHRLCALMREVGIDTALIGDNANIYYLSGRVYCGHVFVDARSDRALFLVRRPNHLSGSALRFIRKIEEAPQVITDAGIDIEDVSMGLEYDIMPYSTAERIKAAMCPREYLNVSGVLRKARSVKTPYEIDKMRRSGIVHTELYKMIPDLYREGMSDVELQIAIETEARNKGCLGQFRISGSDMELFMGNILAGDNADTPSPYDFAMGGAGADPSLPVGANGTIIRHGMTVMVDLNGNFTGYMTDMSRTFSLGQPDETARRAHKLSIDICTRLSEMGRPGVEAKEMYRVAHTMAEEAGLAHYFMGHRQQAGFVGHGIGIQVNELPVIAPRSRDVLAAGNVIALEPKFVIPGVGPVGIENTYVVTPEGMQCMTFAPEHMIDLML